MLGMIRSSSIDDFNFFRKVFSKTFDHFGIILLYWLDLLYWFGKWLELIISLNICINNNIIAMISLSGSSCKIFPVLRSNPGFFLVYFFFDCFFTSLIKCSVKVSVFCLSFFVLCLIEEFEFSTFSSRSSWSSLYPPDTFWLYISANISFNYLQYLLSLVLSAGNPECYHLFCNFHFFADFCCRTTNCSCSFL